MSRLVTPSGDVLVDDVRRPGTLNDPEFGGLGAFAWHHARGRTGRTRLDGAHAWEVSGRICARDNAGFGVSAARIVRTPRNDDDPPTLVLDVFLSDGATFPRPLMRVRYRYALRADALTAWISATQLCPHGRCGRTRQIAFVKEPKLVAHATGGGFTRMATFDDRGRLVCVYTGGGRPRGPILETGQCAADVRTRLRLDRDGSCPCLDVTMRSPAGPWESGRGFDAWAVAAGNRPAARALDTGSVDGLVWSCHESSPDAQVHRRWEATGRRRLKGPYLSVGGLFPAWEGGRGGYDCEPLARAFGPRGETFTAVATYSVTP